MLDASVDLVERVAGAVIRQLEEKYGRIVPVVDRMSEWLDPTAAAGYLKMTPKALEHLRARRSGPPSHRISGKVRYWIEDLRTWAASQKEAVS